MEENIRSTVRHVDAAQQGSHSTWDRLTAKIWEETRPCIRATDLPTGWHLDDLAQRANVSAFLSIGTFESVHPDSFRRWVRSILKNRLTDLWRYTDADKRGGDAAVVRLDDMAGEDQAIGDKLVDDRAYTPLVEIEVQEGQRRMREAEAKLEAPHRQVLQLREDEGLPHKEIAERMQLVNTDAARFLYHLARRKRAAGMKDYFETHVS